MGDERKPLPTLTYSGPDMAGHVRELRGREDAARAMGGPERVDRQHASGKLTVRERIDLLFDEGSFDELGLLAHHQSSSPAMQGKETPADGVVCGIGRVDGRRVAVIAYDFKQIEQAPEEERDAVRNRLIETVREQIGPYIAAGFLDDLIDPADTRRVICRGLATAETRKVERPWRKHGVLPV